jgi:uncharacterized circularly permuted ATP-grasp superfamily protein/uncharacterized alpha-E superfamily protein
MSVPILPARSSNDDAAPDQAQAQAQQQAQNQSQTQSQAQTPARGPSTTAAYAARRLPLDELGDAQGQVRAAWRSFADRFDALPPDELARRWEQARHLIHDNGVSFNVYGDDKGMERPWPLGPMPIVIAPDEHAALSAGLAQRARVLDAILADIYGPQRLLDEGLLPAELVLAHPGYLRACRGIVPPGGRFLHLYAADLVRPPSAEWHVLADRTQSPSGAGYALENRLIVSRLLPDEFRECHAERLAPFFQQVRRTLAALAPNAKDNPRVVLLSPGPYNATYFEQAFLAQYLGYMLVEGADLTVREGVVYLKTLGGLHRVDVILRRLNDDFCDPVELRVDSALGVPGLVEAMREGNVAVANALGSGVVQTAAIIPFLPGICRALLGEDLKLPAVETWWCGEDRVLAHVLAKLPEMVIKPAFPMGRTEPIFCDELDAEALEELQGRLRATPSLYVAQRRTTLSTTPLWEGGELQPRRLLLRTFLVADESGGGGYRTMAGGLGVVAARDQRHDITIQRGAASQDTWVVADGPVSTLSLLKPAGAPVELSRGGGDLPSRVADNLFWLGRYAERADAMTRLARTAVARLPDGAEPFDTLVAALRAQARVAAPAAEGVAPKKRDREPFGALSVLLFDPDTHGSLADTLRSVHRVGRAIRDRLSSDTWRVITALDQEMRDAETWAGGVSTTGAVSALLDRLVALLAGLSGLVMDSMSRGHGWRFLELGRRLERALSLAVTIDATLKIARPAETFVLEALLEAADSAITYRRRYLASLHAAAVLDLLLADPTNPRSIVFQLAALLEHVVKLPHLAGRARDGIESALAQGADTLLSRMEEVSVRRLAEVDPDGRRPLLATVTAELIRELPALSDALTESYLNHATQARQLARAWPRDGGGS